MIPCPPYHLHRLDQHPQRKDIFPLKINEEVASLTALERKEAPDQEEGLAVDPEVALGAQREQRPHHESPAQDCEEDREEDREENPADAHPAYKFHHQDPLLLQARQHLHPRTI